MVMKVYADAPLATRVPHETALASQRKLLPGSSRDLTTGQAGERLEREADAAASAAVDSVVPAPMSLSVAGTGVLQRQGGAKTKSDEEKYKEAAKKAGEAFLKTEPGKQIEKKGKELGEAFISTLPGKIVTGAAAAGAIAAIAATNSELPMQVPEIPLDKITPGLSMKIKWEGPVLTPKAGSITFKYKFGAGGRQEKAKPKQTRAEKQREENTRMAAELYQFREGLKSPEQRAREQQQFWDAYWSMRANDPLNPLRIPGLQPRTGALPLVPRREEEETPIQRKEARRGPGLGRVPTSVYDTVRRSGQPLDAATRRFMETRFGHDFGGVRVHAGTRAGSSARAVEAAAYTVGSHVVFSPGQYAPASSQGRQLLAHELAHVVQQRAAPAVGQTDGQRRPATATRGVRQAV